MARRGVHGAGPRGELNVITRDDHTAHALVDRMCVVQAGEVAPLHASLEYLV